MNGVGVLTVLLTIVFPFNSSSFFPPAWAMFAVLFFLALSVAGMGLAIRDFFQGERFVGCLGFGLCGWPWALLLAPYIIRMS